MGILSWRDTAINSTFRVICFSVGGAYLYVFAYLLLRHCDCLLPPNHLFPQVLAAFGPDTYLTLLWPFLGHALGSAVFAFFVVGVAHLMARVFGRSLNPNAWDVFTGDMVDGRWVAVSLKNGESYAGILKVVDNRVQSGERDLVLTEPARFSEEKRNFVSTSYSAIYLSAESVETVAAVAQPGDDRIIAINNSVFPEETYE